MSTAHQLSEYVIREAAQDIFKGLRLAEQMRAVTYEDVVRQIITFKFIDGSQLHIGPHSMWTSPKETNS